MPSLKWRSDTGYMMVGAALPELAIRWHMIGLVHCMYSSAASDLFAEHEIPQLLEKTRKANAMRDITGMLLYIEGSFFQVLEGPPQAVDALYRTICADRRHQHVTMIIREAIAARSFADWTMGFATLGRLEAGELVGQNDFFTRASCLEELNAGRAKKLLMAFSRGRWHAETEQRRAQRHMR